jgi:hypothetical protein
MVRCQALAARLEALESDAAGQDVFGAGVDSDDDEFILREDSEGGKYSIHPLLYALQLQRLARPESPIFSQCGRVISWSTCYDGYTFCLYTYEFEKCVLHAVSQKNSKLQQVEEERRGKSV